MKRILFALAVLLPTHAAAFDFPIADTATVDLGEVGGELAADVIVDPAAGNLLSAGPDGLLAVGDGTGTDDQALSLSGTTLSLEDGGDVDLSSFVSAADPDEDPTNEIDVTTLAPNATNGTDVFVNGILIGNIPDNDTISPANLDNDPTNEIQTVTVAPNATNGTDVLVDGVIVGNIPDAGDDTSTSFDITSFGVSGANTIEMEVIGDDGGSDIASFSMAETDECGVTANGTAPVSANNMATYVEGERNAWRRNVGSGGDFWDDAALQALPVGVQVAGTPVDFTWTNPSACRNAIVYLTARVGNTEFEDLADGNSVTITYSQSGLFGTPFAHADTSGNMIGTVERFAYGSAFEPRSATIGPGATITATITPTIRLNQPYNPNAATEITTNAINFVMIAVREY